VEIKRLSWDSDFFGIEVFGSWVHDLPDAGTLIPSLRDTGAGLVYIFLQQNLDRLHGQLLAHGAVLYDEKITYAKAPEPGAPEPGGSLPGGSLPGVSLPGGSRPYPGSGDIIEAYRGPLTDDLLRLSYLAGHESRFRKDPRLSGSFETLYRLWITNSLNGSVADRVFVCRTEEGIRGMVTCKIGGDGQGSIGLIATDASCQGRGIGRRLVRMAEEYCSAKGATALSVVTQASNTQACRFYENAGFTVCKRENVYHLWLN
jgi:ribosomal protein S18 acetylase RimI-like enzyme